MRPNLTQERAIAGTSYDQAIAVHISPLTSHCLTQNTQYYQLTDYGVCNYNIP